MNLNRYFISFLRSFFVVTILLSPSKANAQYYGPPSVDLLDMDLYYSFYSLLMFDNGDMPFKQNGKWGMKSLSGKEVIPAQYDTLLRGRFNQCIALRSGKYELIDMIQGQCFDEPMDSIHYFDRDDSAPDGLYIAVDRKGRTSRYPISDQYWDILSDSTNKVNHLIYKARPRQKYIPGSYYNSTGLHFGEDYLRVASIPLPEEGMFRNNFIAKDDTLFYYDTEKNGAYSLTDKYIYIKSKKLDREWLIDFQSKDTLFEFPLNGMQYFERNDSSFFLVNYISPNDTHTVVYSEDGRSVFDQKGSFRYGYKDRLFSKSNEESTRISDLYSYPEFKLLESDVLIEADDSYYTLLNKAGTTEHILYLRNKEIYRFNCENRVYFEYTNYPGVAPIIGIHYQIDAYGYEGMILDSTGRLIHCQKNFNSFSYNDKLKQFEIRVSIDYDHPREQVWETEWQEILGIYDEQNECFRFSKLNPETFDQITDNYVLYYESQDFYNGSSQSIMSIDGDCFRDKLYDEVRRCVVGDRIFVYTRDDSGTMVMDKNLQPICQNCYISPIRGNYGEEIHEREFILWTPDIHSSCVELVDQNLKPVLPEKYNGISYRQECDCFIVLDENMETDYIRYTDTEYYKEHHK